MENRATLGREPIVLTIELREERPLDLETIAECCSEGVVRTGRTDAVGVVCEVLLHALRSLGSGDRIEVAVQAGERFGRECGIVTVTCGGGVDCERILRAAASGVSAGALSGGGSALRSSLFELTIAGGTFQAEPHPAGSRRIRLAFPRPRRGSR